MSALLPEEEEYESARTGGSTPPPSRSTARAQGPLEAATYARAMRLIALAMGLAIMLGVMMALVLLLYWATGQRWLLALNIGIIALAVVAIAYLMYERGKLTMRP